VRAGALRDARLAAQLLARRQARSPAEVLAHLLAVQAQDLGAARLALRARSRGLTAATFDAALGDGGDLCVTWLMRGTLHLVRRDDHAWLNALTAPTRLATSRRRLGQERVSPAAAERAVALVERALSDDGPQTRAELGAVLAHHGIRSEGQALPHLLMLAALRGVCVLGPIRADGRQAFALARDHVGPPGPAIAREGALALLARRYLAAHGPATVADLAAWSGLPLRDARAGLAAIAGALVDHGDGHVALADAPSGRRTTGARLLGAFDPALLGYARRDWLVDAADARRVHPGGGVLRPVALAGGRAVATWSARRRGGRLAVALDPFAELTPAWTRALQREARDVARFEGLAYT
jgi:winged helix DNA-binding protein